MIDSVLAVCLTVIFSVITRFPYLHRPVFPTPVESDTMDVVANYEQGREFDPKKPPLGYFAYWVTKQIEFKSDAMRRLFPATFAALVSPVLTVAMLGCGVSPPSAFAIGTFVAVENSFGQVGRECAGNSLFDLFAVLALLCFMLNERRGKCGVLLALEAAFVSLAMCTDSCGVILFLHILVTAVAKLYRKPMDLFERVRFLLFLALPMSFFIVLVHISLVSGPSDIYPFRTRFFHVVGSILQSSERENILPILIKVNPVAMAFSVIGIVWDLLDKQFDLVPGFFLSLLSMFYSTHSFILKVHLVMLFGIISVFTLLDGVDTHKLRPLTMVSVTAVLVGFFLQFLSQM